MPLQDDNECAEVEPQSDAVPGTPVSEKRTT